MPTSTAVQIEWLSKDAAAARLHVSPRSILAMASEGKIQSKRERDPATNQVVVKLHAGDVERIAYERAHPETAQSPQGGPPQALQAPLTPKGHDMGTVALLRALVGTTVPSVPIVKPWLDLEQAAEYSGLPASYLLGLILDGKLAALDVGVRKGGRFRVCRKDLDALQGALFAPESKKTTP